MILQFQRRWTGCNHRSHDNLQQDLVDRRMAGPVDPVLSHQCQDCPASSANQAKLLRKITLNRWKPKAEKIIAEEQAGFKAGRSTTEQIFNLQILCEKYLQHQQDLYHVFVDFKKAFDRVWHAALWATMKKYNISTNLIQSSKTSLTRPLVPSSSTAAWETGSGQQLKSDRDVYSHPPS